MEKMEWKRVGADIFWGEVAPCDHVLQIYENDSVFLDTLAGFVGGGIKSGECVIVIATKEHLKMLRERMTGYGIKVDVLIGDDRYIPLNAEDVLSTFMVNGWPDEILFNQTVSSLFEQGLCKNRRIRAFGEMVALLWAKGLNGATVQLEHLWNKFCAKHEFSLFCAYPKTGFTQNIADSLTNICRCHTKMIDGTQKQLTEVIYANVPVAHAG
ncbi:MAG TPA: MEDS domain-containing protein [Chitinophagaceae bacterium]|nr:MEDS domain-containing protein [Chitinophagaceae bacterium]